MKKQLHKLYTILLFTTGMFAQNNALDFDDYRDTIPSDFGISNITDIEPASAHMTEEIIIGGINAKVQVIATVL